VELRALRGDAHQAPAHEPHAEHLGWQLVGSPGESEARAWPMLAAALYRSGAEARAFVSLALIDDRIWREVADLSPTERVHRWLRSPGRRLVVELELLKRLRGDEATAGATELSWEAVKAAAGADASGAQGGAARLSEWRVLHAAIPGSALETWTPPKEDPIAALYLLEQAEVALARGGALAWLLDRAVQAPVVTVGGVRRDLRDELPTRLGVALDREGAAGQLAAAHEQVEALCLTHAALIAERRAPGCPTAEVWHVARWLQGIVLHSPFYGGDPTAVAARLRALLPRDLAFPKSVDALHPSRFYGEGLALRDLSLLAGLLRHLRQPRNLREALPGPLIRWLEGLAQAPMTEAERRAEAAWRSSVDDPLGWGAAHVAPVLLARKLLVDANLPLLKGAREEVQFEVVEALRHVDAQVIWPVQVIEREGDALTPAAAARAHVLWRTGEITERPAWVRPAVGAGLLHVLTAEEGKQLLEQVRGLAPEWSVKLLRRLCDRVRARLGEAEWEGLARAMLVDLVGIVLSVGVEDRVRLEGAARVIELARARVLPGWEEAMRAVASAAGRPPLRGQPTVRSALERLGFAVGGA
jgi:hypothetical protein